MMVEGGMIAMLVSEIRICFFPCKGLLCGFGGGPEQTLDGIKTESLNRVTRSSSDTGAPEETTTHRG